MVRPSQLTPMQRLLLAISLPITLVFLYFLFRKNDDEDDEEADAQVVTSRQTVIEVKVPFDAVGAVIGAQGAQIKMIRNATKARLNFKDKDADMNQDRILVIQGTQEGAQKAELMVRQIIVDQPQIVTEILHVPNAAVGRIIGRNGETIRSISHQSKAKVSVERSEARDLGDVTQILLKGTPLAVETAKMLISEKVEDQKALMEKKASEKFKRTGVVERRDSSKLRSGGDGSFTEVYVSAVEHPGHFWVQLLDRNALRLSTLVDDMALYYGSLGETQNKDFAPVVGDIVAAPFSEDNAWYRAQIVDVLGDDEVDLYFVDYGDSLVISKERIRRLRTDFRELPFQAKECSLADVGPCSGDDVWSEEAIVAFENLVHVAQWKALMSRNVGSTAAAVPSLQLIDTNGEMDVDVAEELVRRGFAVRPSSRATRTTSLPSADDKVTASILTSKDADARLGETRMQLTEADYHFPSGDHHLFAGDLATERRDQLLLNTSATDILHEPGGSCVTDTGYFSGDLNHRLPSYVTGPYEGVCDHVNGNAYYHDDEDDDNVGTEETVVSVRKNLSLGLSPAEQTSADVSQTRIPVAEASQLEVSLSDQWKGIDVLEEKDVDSVAKVENFEYAKIPLQNETASKADLRSTEARDSSLALQSVEALDVGSSASVEMPDVTSIVPEKKILIPLQEEEVVRGTRLGFFPSCEAGELLAETRIRPAHGTEMDTGTESLSAEIPSGKDVDILSLQNLEAALKDIPTEISHPISNSILFHLSESYPSIKMSLHLGKLRTDLNMSSSEAVEAHQSCLTEGRPVALKQLALVKLANEYLTIRESLELSKHGLETDANLAETKDNVETDGNLTEINEDEILKSLHEAISQTDESRRQQSEDLSKSYPSVQNSLFLNDQRKILTQEFQSDQLDKSEAAAIHSKLCAEYPSVRECLALSGSKAERFPETGNLVSTVEQQKDVMKDIEVMQSHSDMCSLLSISKGIDTKLEADQITQKAEEVLKSPTEFACHEIVGSQSGLVLTTMPEWKDGTGSRQSEKESIVSERESEIEQQQPIVSDKESDVEQQPIVSEKEIEQQPIVSEKETEIEQQPIVSEKEIEQQPIVSEKETEIEQQPIVSEKEVEQQPIVSEKKAEIEQPIVSEKETEIEQQQPIVSEKETEIEQQQPIVGEKEIEQPIVSEKEIEQQPIVSEKEIEQPIVSEKETEIEQQQPIVGEKEIEQPIVSEKEIEQQPIVSEKEIEQPIVSEKETEIEQQPIVSQIEAENEQQSIVVQKEPETKLEKVPATEPSAEHLLEQTDLYLNLKQIYASEIDALSHYFPALCRLSDYESGNIRLPVSCRPEWTTDDFDGLVSYIEGAHEKQHSVKHVHHVKPAEHHKKHDHISKQEPVKLHEYDTKKSKAVGLPPNLAAQAFKAGLLDLESATTDEEVSEVQSAGRGEDNDDGGFIVVESRKRRRLRSRCSAEREESEEADETCL